MNEDKISEDAKRKREKEIEEEEKKNRLQVVCLAHLKNAIVKI